MADKKWLQKADKRMEKKGTKGSFTVLAHRHDETPMQYAHDVVSHPKHHSEAVRKKAQFAINANK